MCLSKPLAASRPSPGSDLPREYRLVELPAMTWFTFEPNASVLWKRYILEAKTDRLHGKVKFGSLMGALKLVRTSSKLAHFDA